MRPGRRWTLRVLFAAAGLGVVTYLVIHVGPSRVLAALLSAAPWLPLAFAFEGVRMLSDAAGTYFALGKEERRRVSRFRVVRAQIIGSAGGHILPGGRLGEEGTKVALLAGRVGAGPASAAAAVNESVTLLAGALFSAPCALAAAALEAPSLSWALAAHGIALGALGLGLRAAMRRRGPLSWLGRRFRRLRSGIDRFLATAREARFLPLRPLAVMIGARVAEGGAYVVLAHAVGIELTPARALAVLGVQMVAVALGSILPAQLGVTEVAFALWGGAIGAAPAQALAVPLLAHLIQLAFVAVGSLVPIVWPMPPAAGRERARRSGPAPSQGDPADAPDP